METALDSSAMALSYLIQLLLLPIHAWRLTQIRLTAARLQYQLKLDLHREVVAIRTAAAEARHMETELARSALALRSSRQAIVEAFRVGIANIRERIRVNLESQLRS